MLALKATLEACALSNTSTYTSTNTQTSCMDHRAHAHSQSRACSVWRKTALKRSKEPSEVGHLVGARQETGPQVHVGEHQLLLLMLVLLLMLMLMLLTLCISLALC